MMDQKTDVYETMLANGKHVEIQSESKQSPLRFSDIFPKRLGIFNQCFTHILYVPIYATLHIFIQLSLTLTKL